MGSRIRLFDRCFEMIRRKPEARIDFGDRSKRPADEKAVGNCYYPRAKKSAYGQGYWDGRPYLNRHLSAIVGFEVITNPNTRMSLIDPRRSYMDCLLEIVNNYFNIHMVIS